MSFECKTNNGRVEKIVDILSLIAKSAEANRAPVDALRELLAPVNERLVAMDAITTRGTVVAQRARPYPTGAAAERIDGLSPVQLIDLISLCLSRLDKDVYNRTR